MKKGKHPCFSLNVYMKVGLEIVIWVWNCLNEWNKNLVVNIYMEGNYVVVWLGDKKILCDQREARWTQHCVVFEGEYIVVRTTLEWFQRHSIFVWSPSCPSQNSLTNCIVLQMSFT